MTRYYYQPRWNKEKRKKGQWWKKILKWFFLTGLLLVIAGLLSVAGLFAYYAKDLPDPNKINKRIIAQSTKIYDRTGKHLLYEIFGEEKRTVVPLEDISPAVIAATIALEDRNFYHHHGIDFRGLLRAVLKNARGRREGASTITQQFVKNSILTPDRTIKRKIKEIILSLEIETKFSKEEILQMYLNEIPYGSNAYGIEAAAQTFFGRSAKDLTLAQAALLACLPNKPGRYSPTGTHTDLLLNRWRYALDAMAEMGFITKEQAEEAKKEDILSQVRPRRTGLLAPHFVFYIKDKLIEEFGEETLEKQGLRVYTTLDWDLQQIAERVVKEGVEKNGQKYGFSNAALVATDPKTGEVLAMVGSKDYWSDDIDGKVNVAISDKRQPGSSFKPYVYAAAFEKGYTPNTFVFDVETSFGRDGSGKKYKPQNYTGTFSGPVKLKEALARSLNIPAVKVLYLAGIERVVKLARDLGITTLEKNKEYGLSLALGSANARLLDHVGAFAVLANKGRKPEQKVFLRITDANGKILYQNRFKREKKVLDKNVALQIAQILSNNELRTPAFGKNNPLVIPGYQVMAKTGTTNDYRDGWLLGASPSLAAGVWAGNNDNKPMRPGAAGVYVAAPIWHDFMTQALEKFPQEDFEEPEEVETGKPILDGTINFGPQKLRVCEYRKKRYCLANNSCPDHKIEKRKFFTGHCILYYVDKDDPLGDPPQDPTKDPQFERWERGVLEWGKEHLGGSKHRIAPDRECRDSDFD